MKKSYFIYSISMVVLMTWLSGCDNFLKDTSGDLLIPKRVSEFAPLLYNEGYPKSYNTSAAWLNLMTDDVEMNYLEGVEDEQTAKEFHLDVDAGDGQYAYIWDANVGDHIYDSYYDECYANINACNIVISKLPTMEYEESELGAYHFLAAQAYALRAYYYFCLINAYAQPYDKTKLKAPGVVIKLTPETSMEPKPRATSGEIWEQINGDIDEAIKRLAHAEPNLNRHLLTSTAIYLLASRIALFQEDWAKTIKYAQMVLSANSFLYDLNTVPKEDRGTYSVDDFAFLNLENNKEILFTFGGFNRSYKYISSPMGRMFTYGFRVSKTDDHALMKMYQEGDLRAEIFFNKDVVKVKEEYDWDTNTTIKKEITEYNYNYPVKYKGSGNGAFENWRTAEAYLNLTEAYARSGDSAKAIEYLNMLREKRIDRDSYQPLNASAFASNSELVQYIWDERRRELCYEESHRFWDLRRQGMPRLEHKLYTGKDYYELYVLEAKSNNYTLQIPPAESHYNDLVVLNKRDIITPIQ